MALQLANIKEGSEEARTKRAVRRYLNKKKQRPEPVEESIIDEGSEESRIARQKRIAQKKKEKKEPIEEAVIPGSLNHMMHELHNHHAHGLESPHYHIHPIGRSYAPSGGNSGDTHHYAVVSRNSLHDDSGTRFPAHTFNLWHEGGKYHVTHRAKVE